MGSVKPQVKHYVISPGAFNQITRLLEHIAYKQAAPILDILTRGTKAIFEPQARIVDNPDEPTPVDKPDRGE